MLPVLPVDPYTCSFLSWNVLLSSLCVTKSSPLLILTLDFTSLEKSSCILQVPWIYGSYNPLSHVCHIALIPADEPLGSEKSGYLGIFAVSVRNCI